MTPARNRTEQNLRITLNCLEIRETMQRLLGDGYQSTIEPYRLMIRGISKGRGIPVLEAVLILARQVSGDDVGLIISAGVEECQAKGAES